MAYIKEREGKNGISYQVNYYINGKKKANTFAEKDYYYTKVDKDGKPIKNTPTQARREALSAAKSFVKEIESQINLGIAKDYSNIKFKDYAPGVFDIRDKNASFQTKKNRKYYLEILINDYCGDWRIATDFKPANIKKLFQELSKYSDQVLIKFKVILNIVLDSAVEDEIIEYNPLIKLKLNISQKNLKEVKPIDINTFKLYLQYAKKIKKYFNGLLLMFYTGMRIGEALAIEETDFNFDNNTYLVNKNRQRNGKIGPVKKGRNRTGIIHEKLSELYYEIKAENEENKKIFGKKYKDNKLLICNEDGSPISYNAFRMYLQRLDEKTGIKLRPHQLRHTFATFLRGMELKDIQAIGGWKDVDTLVNIYQEHNEFKEETILSINNKFKNALQ